MVVTQTPVLTVRDVSLMMQKAVESAFDAEVWVRGELSNVGQPTRLGHLFFTLVGDGATLACVWWHYDKGTPPFPLQDGLEVEALGRLTTFPTSSRYALRVKDAQPAGEGALLLLWKRLRERLAAEGLLAPERKRPMPRLPKRVGLVTSARGAALGDVMKTLHDAPVVVLLSDAQVQGVGAPESVVAALSAVAAQRPDLVIVARGGGAKEELWTFNDERVVRAVASCPIPVISAVGHEADVTLADEVADVRASTPTQAAAMIAQAYERERALVATEAARLQDAVEDAVARRLAKHDDRARKLRLAVLARLSDLAAAFRPLALALARQRPDLALERQVDLAASLGRRLSEAASERVETAARLLGYLSARRAAAARERLALERDRLHALAVGLTHHRPRLEAYATALGSLAGRLRAGARERAGAFRAELEVLAGKLASLNPLAVLGRGYAVVFRDGAVVRDAAILARGDAVRVQLARGGFDAQVTGVQEESDATAPDV